MYPIRGNHVPVVETHYRINEFHHEAAQRRLVKEANQANDTHRYSFRKFSLVGQFAQRIGFIMSRSASRNNVSPEKVLTLQTTSSESQ